MAYAAKIDVYSLVTNQIVEAFESAMAGNVQLPWNKPFSEGFAGSNVPCNATTNKPYSGVNVLIGLVAMAKGYSKPRFLTYKQAQECGGNVKKGETGHKIVYFQPVVTGKKTDSEDAKSYALLKHFTVFNVDQCENLPEAVVSGPLVPVKTVAERNAEAEGLMQTLGVPLMVGNKACYIPSLHKIMLPAFEAFTSASAYYATAFHEMAHATGHKSILDRDLTGRFGTEAYAAEELIAELSAAFMCAEFGFDTVSQATAYIQSWIKLLKNDKKAIFTASKFAQKAVDCIRSKALADNSEAIAA